MPTTDSPDQPAPLEVSARTWSAIARVASAGRVVLLAAGLLSLLSVFIDTNGIGALTKLVLTFLTLAMAAVAALGMTRPRRAFDLAAVALALTLAGAWGFYAFATLGNDFGGKLYVLQFFAWLATLIGGLAVATVLVPGPSAAVPFDVARALGRTPRGGGSGVAPSGAPAADPAPAPGGGRPGAVADHDSATTAVWRPEPGGARGSGSAGGTGSGAVRGPGSGVAGEPDSGAAGKPPAPSVGGSGAASGGESGPVPGGESRPASVGESRPTTGGAAAAPAASVPSAFGRPSAPTPGRSTPTSSDTTRTGSKPAPPQPDEAPEAGWYPSSDGATARWWDGRAWTGERRPLADFDDDAPA